MHDRPKHQRRLTYRLCRAAGDLFLGLYPFRHRTSDIAPTGNKIGAIDRCAHHLGTVRCILMPLDRATSLLRAAEKNACKYNILSCHAPTPAGRATWLGHKIREQAQRLTRAFVAASPSEAPSFSPKKVSRLGCPSACFWHRLFGAPSPALGRDLPAVGLPEARGGWLAPLSATSSKRLKRLRRPGSRPSGG